MYTRLKQIPTIALCLLASLVVLNGCSQQSARNTAHCALTATNNIDRLFAEVENNLDDPVCHYSWPEYKQRLFATAKGNPGPDNEARFATLLRSSIERGIISRRQGQELFSRYFDAEFYSVKTEPRSSCASLRKKPALYASMQAELALKREGMLGILNDEDRFRRAQQHYSDLHLVFDAVEVACSQEL